MLYGYLPLIKLNINNSIYRKLIKISDIFDQIEK
jgi:hypothetical protein